jgi:low affinity Fe/Cu permease
MNKIIYIGGNESHYYRSHFIINKVYEYYDGYTSKLDYYIVEHNLFISKKFFITLEKYREQRINKILDEMD